MNTLSRFIREGSRPLIILLTLGLVVRLIGLYLVDQLGVRIVDERHYFQLASSIVNGWGFAWGAEVPTSIRPPLYPAILALIWTIVGYKSLFAIRVVQIFISLLNVLLVYQLGRRIFSERVAWVAAGIFCFYPSFLVFNYLILTEVFFTCLFTLFLLGYVYLLQSETTPAALGTGVVLGVAALTRSILWPFPIVLVPLAFFSLKGSYRRRLVLVSALLLGYLLVITPWAVRNTELQKVSTIVNSMGGITLLMGNYEHTPLNRAWDPMTLSGKHSIFANLSNEYPESHQWTEGQKEKWAQKRAFQFMLEHPALTLKRTIIKFGSFWGLERTIVGGLKRYYHPPRWLALLTMFLIPISYGFVMVLACLGLFLAAPEDKRIHTMLIAIMLFMSGLHALVFGHSRYHLPLIPILILYGASAIMARSWMGLGRSVTTSAGPLVAYTLLLVAWGREVMLVEADKVRLLLNALLGS